MNESCADTSPLICRGCLRDWGEMKNMYDWGLDVDFFRYTDIAREPSEGLPVLLCLDCETDLKTVKDFTKRCQQSNRILKNNLRMVSNDDGNSNKSKISSLITKNKLTMMITAPDPEDKINLPCPFDCEVAFIKKTLLSNHLKNTHNLHDNYEIDLQYYCSVEGCIYNSKSIPNKSFSGRKFLNQHYNKSHREKKYYCDRCKMKFALETDLCRHSRTCNSVYACPVCNIEYNTNESYLVHLKRRHPNLHSKYKLDKKAAKLLIDNDKFNSKQSINNVSLKRKKSNKDCNDLNHVENVRNIEIINGAVEVTNLDNVDCKILDESVPMKVQKLQTVHKSEFVLIPRTQVIHNTQDDLKNLVFIKDQAMNLNISMNEVSDHKSDKNTKQESIANAITEKSLTKGIEDGMGNEDNNDNRTVNVEVIPGFVEEYTVAECQENTIESVKRSSGTQIPESIPSDETLNSWTNKTDFEMQTDGISTQTVLDEILSLKPQNGEDEVFFPESMSDIETQTFPFDFPSNRCNKETQFSTSMTPDLSFKETQTCVCFCHSSRSNCTHFGGLISSQICYNVISTETQTCDSRKLINSDVMLSFSSAETQTCFDSNDSI